MAKLYLIPNVLSQGAGADSLAGNLVAAIKDVRLFFVEEPKSARALLKKIDPNFPLSKCTYINLNEHSPLKEIEKNFKETANQDMGIISEAGYPCIADPGAELVRLVHQAGGEVVPLPGASSIILALAASGLNGQNFAFNGYLPKDKDQRLKKIKQLEQRSQLEGQTQIMMEAPYRSQALLEDLVAVLSARTLLCVACDITGSNQMIRTQTVGQWKKMSINLPKIPALFLL